MKVRNVLLMLAISLVIVVAVTACAAPTPAPTPVPPTAAPKPTDVPKPPASSSSVSSVAPTVAPTAVPPTAAPKVGVTWKIGFISAATGAGASLGVPERDVATLVAAQLKASGMTGPDGVKHDVQFIIYDDQSSADTAVTLARRLIETDLVQVLVATTQSGTSQAIVPVATEAKIPNISMASARAIIEDPATKKMREWIFKPVPENSHSAGKQAEYLQAVKVTKVCHLYENSAYGQDTLAAASASFPKSGITIVYSDAFDPKATEFPQIAKVKASGCEAVVIGAIPPASPVMNVAVRDALPNMRIIHGHGSCSPDLVKAAGKAAEGTVMPCGKILVADSLPDSDPVKALNVKLIKDYTDATKASISTFAGHAYDSLQLAIAALKTLPDGGTLVAQRQALRDALETKVIKVPTTHGLYTLSATDHLGFDPAEFAFVVVKDGKFVVLPKDQWK